MFTSKCLNVACTYTTVRVTLRFLRVCVCAHCFVNVCISCAGVGYAPAVACSGPRLGLSLYYFHLVRWMGVLPRNQLLFLRTEDLLANPLHVMKVCSKILLIWEMNG